MKIGVISDTHLSGQEQIPKKLMQELNNMDIILHAGDLGDIQVLKQLQATGKRVYAVWGNMDPPELRNILPEKEIISVGKYKIGLMHGYGPAQELTHLLAKAFKDSQVDVVIFGHSHSPLKEVIGGVLYFNPGSATEKIFASYNSYGVLEINDKLEAKVIRL